MTFCILMFIQNIKNILHNEINSHNNDTIHNNLCLYWPILSKSVIFSMGFLINIVYTFMYYFIFLCDKLLNLEVSFQINVLFCVFCSSSRFEQQDGHLSEVEVNEVLRFVRDVTSEVPSHNAVPRGVVFLVELFLDEGRDVLLDVVLLERLRGAVHGVLLHVLRHVGVLDHGFPVRHAEKIITIIIIILILIIIIH